MNEFVVFWVIASTNLGEEGGLGLVINFSAAIIVCEFDDILVKTGRVNMIREHFDTINDIEEKSEIEEHFKTISQPRFFKTPFL